MIKLRESSGIEIDAHEAERVVRVVHSTIVPTWADRSIYAGGTISNECEQDTSVLLCSDATMEICGNRAALFYFVNGVPDFAEYSIPSRKLLARCGMKHEPHIRRYRQWNGIQHEDWLMSVVGTRMFARFDLSSCREYFGEVFGLDLERVYSGLALAQRYWWTVSIGRIGSPMISFQCTPRAALAAYRLRDLPASKNRRDALLHWVSAHRRSGGEVDVRKHLRGSRRFEWNGLQCVIEESQFDSLSVARKPRWRSCSTSKRKAVS